VRQLRDTETALREAQTKAGHAELARDELLAALAAERSAKEAAEEQVRQLLAAAPPVLTDGVAPPAASATPGPRRTGPAETGPVAVPKRRGRPPGSTSKALRTPPPPSEAHVDEAQAVEWWVPGWKERI
jgi:hypothetical protein